MVTSKDSRPVMELKAPKRKLGVIVNPIAGIGGRVGLKGSDGPEVLRLAQARGARPEAAARAAEALSLLTPLTSRIEVLTWDGAMGAVVCRQAGFAPRVGGAPAAGEATSAADTEAAAAWMLEEGVDLLLFVGGDGTARNICRAVGERLTVLGVPAGVKIHSAVFAVTPRSAGVAARQFFEQEAGRCRVAEVMDIDEEAFRRGEVTARLFGSLCVPDINHHMQGAKVGGIHSEAEALDGIAQTVIEAMDDSQCAYLIGPGTTTRAVKERLGINGTLLGVDVICGGRQVAADADERTLLSWVADRPARIVVTIIGGQGHLFGRGNQQISPEVIRRVGCDRIMVVATQEKLVGLAGRPLIVDTGDSQLDRQLEGHLRVITGYRNYTVYRVGL